MIVKPLTADAMPAWDSFCDQNSDAWFLQTTDYLKYQEAYRPAAKTVPLHFMIVRNDSILGVCPLATESHMKNGNQYSVFSLGEDYLPSPVVSDSLQSSDRDRVLKNIYAEIDRLANENSIVRVSQQEIPLTTRFLESAPAPVNIPLAFGYLDASQRTQVIDVRKTEAELWSRVRQAYRSLIHRAEENFQFRVLDQKNVTPALFKTYQDLHLKAAGRVTRPQLTFDIMHDWIKKGRALLVQALKGDDVVASALLMIYKNNAHYKSGANDPDLETEWALGHFLQWKTILELKNRGAVHYEIGTQFDRPSLIYNPSDKEMHIAFFKRGFGGKTIPSFRAEKYYSADFFKDTFTQRLNEAAAGVLAVNKPR